MTVWRGRGRFRTGLVHYGVYIRRWQGYQESFRRESEEVGGWRWMGELVGVEEGVVRSSSRVTARCFPSSRRAWGQQQRPNTPDTHYTYIYTSRPSAGLRHTHTSVSHHAALLLSDDDGIVVDHHHHACQSQRERERWNNKKIDDGPDCGAEPKCKNQDGRARQKYIYIYIYKQRLLMDGRSRRSVRVAVLSASLVPALLQLLPARLQAPARVCHPVPPPLFSQTLNVFFFVPVAPLLACVRACGWRPSTPNSSPHLLQGGFPPYFFFLLLFLLHPSPPSVSVGGDVGREKKERKEGRYRPSQQCFCCWCCLVARGRRWKTSDSSAPTLDRTCWSGVQCGPQLFSLSLQSPSSSIVL